jgi:hypothetical protein
VRGGAYNAEARALRSAIRHTWTPLTDTQATLIMGVIAVAPSNPSVIYAGTGEAGNSADSYYGRGVLKSTDGGAARATTAGTPPSYLFNQGWYDTALIADPTDANLVYAGGNGMFLESPNGGATSAPACPTSP